MEIKAELKQPYTDKQRMDFIVEQNHKLGYEIRQVETTYEVEEEVPYTEIETEEIQVPVLDEEGNPVLDEDGNPTFETQTVKKEVVKYRTETVEKTRYNLEAWGYTEEEKAQQERERLAMLNMTGADVERAIYKVKGIDFDDILAMVKDNPAIDEKALKIEFKANNFFRGNPYIEQVGSLLGFTSEMLDRFFETKDYIYLTTCTLTINATPAEATVTGDGSYPYGSLVDYKVELEGYKPYTGSIELLKDTELNIELEKIEEVVDENTTDTTTDVPNEVGE